MSNRGQSSVYDSRHKSWRGPILKNSIDETRDTDSADCPVPVAGSSRQHRQSEDKEIDRYRTSIRRTIKSACPANPPLSSPTPRTVSLPAVTWTQPPMVDYRTRRSAFDFGRPSRIYRDDSEEMCHLRRRSHLLFDELERERQGNSQLRQEVSRTNVGKIKCPEWDSIQRQPDLMEGALTTELPRQPQWSYEFNMSE
ncbi:hypothetical protein ACROYT_G034723 [Oculina patagonica]